MDRTFCLTLIFTLPQLFSQLNQENHEIFTNACPNPSSTLLTATEEALGDNEVPCTALMRFTSRVTLTRCASLCAQHEACRGILYARISSGGSDCILCRDAADNCTSQPRGYKRMNMKPCCFHGEVWNEANDVCECSLPWIGRCCERLPKDCSEILTNYPHLRGPGFQRGFLIQPKPATSPFLVSCYLDYGGYTLIMERTLNSSLDHDVPDYSFNRDFLQYEHGFEINPENYWLGLENIHAIMSHGARYRLDVTIYFQGLTGFYQVYYRNFRIASKSDGYALHFDSIFFNTALNNSAGDALNGSSDPDVNVLGVKFSTPDRDEDMSGEHCALMYNSGWWFNNCSAGVLTAPFMRTADGYINSSQAFVAFWGGIYPEHAIKGVNLKIKRV